MRSIVWCALLCAVGCFSESDVGSGDATGSTGTSSATTGMTSAATTSSTTATSTSPGESSTVDPDTGPSSEEASTTIGPTATSSVDTSGELDSSASGDVESTGPMLECKQGECPSCVMCAFQGPCMTQHVECMGDDTGTCPEILDCAMTCLVAGDPVDCLATTCMCGASDLAHDLVTCVVEECPSSCPMFDC